MGSTGRMRRFLVAGAVPVVGALLLGACGSGVGTSGLTAAIVADAALHTQQSQGADVTLSMTMDFGPGKTFTGTGSGVLDLSTDAADIRLDLSLPASANPGTIEERFTGGHLYFSIPGIEKTAPGKSWIDVPLGKSLSGLPSSGNPADALALLRARGATVTRAGSGTVGGSAVTEYDVRLDPAAMKASLAKLPDLSAQARSDAQAILDKGDLTLTVAVDAQGRLAQVVEHETVPASAIGSSGAPEHVTVTTDFTNYGATPPVAAPDPSTVISLADYEAASSTLG